LGLGQPGQSTFKPSENQLFLWENHPKISKKDGLNGENMGKLSINGVFGGKIICKWWV